MASIVAEAGVVIEQHMRLIGLLQDPDMSVEKRALIAEKRAAYEARAKAPGAGASSGSIVADAEVSDEGRFPPGATMCNKCNTSAVIIMDGCASCLSCGCSKCG